MVNGTEIYKTTERTECPFYGFSNTSGCFLDTKGNQCALIMDSSSPCNMEMGQEKVYWAKCKFNTKENALTIENLLRSTTVFPEETRPRDVSSWEGVPLTKWFNSVVDKKEI